MELNIESDIANREIIFNGKITRHDLEKLKIDNFDQSLLEDKKESSADILLCLELIFRRGKEQGLINF
jgi:hypothetical protein